MVIDFNDFMIRSSGVLMCIIGAYLVKISNIRSLKGLRSTHNKSLNLMTPSRPGRLVWAMGAASVVATGVSFIYLYQDALDGYHQIWPVYMFAASALICALVCAYLVSKLM